MKLLVIFVLIIGILAYLIIRSNRKVDFEIPVSENEIQEKEEPYEWKDYNPITKEEFESAFRKEGLFNKWEYFKNQLRPEIRIKPKHVNEELIELGQSKIGGNPDMPNNENWPIDKNGKKLAFLSQINFEELQSYNFEMPKKGILYFFYDEAQEFWGDSKENSGSFRTIYVADPNNLKRKSAPKNFEILKDGMYKPCKLEFSSAFSLPNWEHTNVNHQFKIGDRGSDAYVDISSSGQYITKLFGHSINVQGAMEYECEMVERGYSWTNVPESEKQSIIDESMKWKLLFQLDSEDEAKMMWGDVGRLYFWIKEDHLKSKQFDKIWMIFQCH